MSGESAPGRGLWLWAGAMSAMLLLNLLPYSSYIAVLPLTKEEWGLSSAQAGAVYSAYLAGYAMAALYVVPLPDRWGCRPVILASMLVSIIGNLLFPIAAQGFVSAMLLRLLPGIGMVGMYMSGLRLIAERFPQRGRGAAMGLFTSCAYLATSISLFLTGSLIPSMGWREAYLVLSAFSALSLVVGYLALRGVDDRFAVGSPRLRLSVIKERAVRLVTLGYIAHSWELFVVRTWLPSFLVALLLLRGYSRPDAIAASAAAAALMLAPGALGPFLGGTLSDRLGRAQAAALILLVGGALTISLGWLGGLPWGLLIALGLLLGLALAADSSIYHTAMVEVADPAWLGSAMAVSSFFGFVAGLAGPIASGWVLDRAPEGATYGIVFGMGGALALVGFLGMLSLSRRR
ncbi:MAG: MFS transporter [Dehalococcoidia bacterium]